MFLSGEYGTSIIVPSHTALYRDACVDRKNDLVPVINLQLLIVLEMLPKPLVFVLNGLIGTFISFVLGSSDHEIWRLSVGKG